MQYPLKRPVYRMTPKTPTHVYPYSETLYHNQTPYLSRHLDILLITHPLPALMLLLLLLNQIHKQPIIILIIRKLLLLLLQLILPIPLPGRILFQRRDQRIHVSLLLLRDGVRHERVHVLVAARVLLHRPQLFLLQRCLVRVVVRQRPAEVLRGFGFFGLLPLAVEAVPFEFEELEGGLVSLAGVVWRGVT